MRSDCDRLKSMRLSNHVLMFVVGKLDFELPLISGFGGLVRRVWFTESEPPIFPRRGLQMTDGANRRARSHERLARKELWPVTTDARIMVGKISDVGKSPVRRPRGRDLVTRVALETLMFVG
jgi:hypothetical protein